MLCPALDQRGLARRLGGPCDIGAVQITSPFATTGTPTSVTTSQATLNGTGDPRGVPGARWYFQWGATSAYGNQTPGGTLAASASAGVSDAITGLAPGTPYHFRLVVSDFDGTTYGADVTATTPPATAPPGPSAPPSPDLFAGVAIGPRSPSVHHGVATFIIACPLTARGLCAGTLAITIVSHTRHSARRRATTIGQVSFRIAAGARARLDIHLKGLGSAKPGKTVAATAVAVAHDSLGKSARTTIAVRLAVAGPARHR